MKNGYLPAHTFRTFCPKPARVLGALALLVSGIPVQNSKKKQKSSFLYGRTLWNCLCTPDIVI